jgi:4-amino-4-deoxy-L-arabinose transferase-like glycosyltransferase
MPNFIRKIFNDCPIQNYNRSLIAIMFLAFVLRLLALIIMNTPNELANVWGATESIVNNLIAGRGYTLNGANPDFFYFPAYPVLLASIRAIGLPFYFAKILQCLMGSLTCLVIYHIGKRAFNIKIGLVAAFIWAIYPYSVIHAQALEDSTFMALFSVLSILLSLILLEKRQVSIAIILGVVCGISILTRSTYLSFLMILLPWLLFHLKLRNIRYITIVILVVILCVSPWVIRNYIRSGNATLGTHGGLSLWVGNNPYIKSLIKANLNQDYLMRKDGFFIPGGSCDNLTPQDDKIYFSKAINFIMSNPVESIENVFLRLGYFYGWRYYFRQTSGPAGGYSSLSLSPSNIEELKADADNVYSSTANRLRSLMYTLSAFPLFIMSLLGLIIYRPILERNRQIILLFILFFTFVHILSIANIRHRQPIDALLTLYASSFVFWFVGQLIFLFKKVTAKIKLDKEKQI